MGRGWTGGSSDAQYCAKSGGWQPEIDGEKSGGRGQVVVRQNARASRSEPTSKARAATHATTTSAASPRMHAAPCGDDVPSDVVDGAAVNHVRREQGCYRGNGPRRQESAGGVAPHEVRGLGGVCVGDERELALAPGRHVERSAQARVEKEKRRVSLCQNGLSLDQLPDLSDDPAH